MESTHEVPFLRLAGSPHERGLAHGKAAKHLIEKNIAFYKKLLKLEDETLRAHAQKFADKIASFRPDFVDEMDGIAKGADVEPVYIYMLNARTELLSINDTVQSECATFFFKNSALLFENWDWSEPSKDLTVLLHITLPNGNTILTFTEAGMLGKVGMSSAGFGVAFNYLYPNAPLSGIPIHALLRALLEASSFEEAKALLSKSENVGTSGNILLADKNGQAIDYELSGSNTSAIPMTGNAIAHTNHYLGGTANDPSAGQGFLTNSYERYTHAEALLIETTTQNVGRAKALLTDRNAGNGMLCRDFIPEEPGHTPTGTIASMVMDLPNQTMHIALDPQNAGSEFKIYTL